MLSILISLGRRWCVSRGRVALARVTKYVARYDFLLEFSVQLRKRQNVLTLARIFLYQTSQKSMSCPANLRRVYCFLRKPQRCVLVRWCTKVFNCDTWGQAVPDLFRRHAVPRATRIAICIVQFFCRISLLIKQLIPYSHDTRYAGHDFLANVYTFAMLSPVRLPSVCLSVTLVHLTQPVEIFGNISTPFGTLAIR